MVFKTILVCYLRARQPQDDAQRIGRLDVWEALLWDGGHALARRTREYSTR
jgi:predicted nicotinamide N-methyase